MGQMKFNATIGELDRVLSELMLLAKGELDAANRQTLKHHAEDMQGVARTLLNKVQVGREHAVLRGTLATKQAEMERLRDAYRKMQCEADPYTYLKDGDVYKEGDEYELHGNDEWRPLPLVPCARVICVPNVRIRRRKPSPGGA